MKPPYAIGSVSSLSGHAIAYRWRSLPKVCRHRASKPQGSSERVLHWQITMDQLIFASLSHTHYWYEVGMLKVPAYDYMGYMAMLPFNLDWRLSVCCCFYIIRVFLTRGLAYSHPYPQTQGGITYLSVTSLVMSPPMPKIPFA